MAWTEANQAKYKRADGCRQNNPTDEEWPLIEPMIPAQGRMGRPRETDPRQVFDAIKYRLASGCQWLWIPACYPPFSTVQNYFHAWSRNGALERMLDSLRAMARATARRRAEPAAAIIDSQSAKTTESGGPLGYGAGKKIKGFAALARRWVVERIFAWMGRCRRLAKDFERTVASSLAWARLAACRFLMRRVARNINS
ncbi:MAG: transposase [Albidovulum sp.]|nr:transposase [Albidovulum sp.]